MIWISFKQNLQQLHRRWKRLSLNFLMMYLHPWNLLYSRWLMQLLLPELMVLVLMVPYSNVKHSPRKSLPINRSIEILSDLPSVRKQFVLHYYLYF